MKNDNIIFLDIDGVLNSEQYARSVERYYGTFDPYRDECCQVCLSNLEYILDEVPNTKIVISSMWRIDKTVKQLKNILESWGFTRPEVIIGKTPVHDDRVRGDEIQEYIDKNNIKNYCIIDDNSDMLESQLDHFVQTNGRQGLMIEDADTVIRVLEKKDE